MTGKKPAGEGSGRPPREARGRDAYTHRLKRMREHGLKPPIGVQDQDGPTLVENCALDLGWGRLIFGQTFADPEPLLAKLQGELPDRRDIAVYVRDPHVLLANAPQELFLDPSHTFRLNLSTYRPSRRAPKGFFLRRLTAQADANAINRIYAARGMVAVPPDFFWAKRDARSICYFVAEDEVTGDILGTVTGVDHARAFNDPERGGSLWCLAVDPQARHPGVGQALVRHLAEYFSARGLAHLDLSVMHDNEQAIALYEKLGFERVPYFTVKRKNPINETLYTGPEVDAELNPYATIIVKEARRRGIHVEVSDAERGFFSLSQGGRTIRCRESLSDMTSAVAMSVCDDKTATRAVVEAAGVAVPQQILADAPRAELEAFLAAHGKVVVKPARGEQGRGVAVGLTDMTEIAAAVETAGKICDTVLIEECVTGEDLRLIVINYKLVAAAVRRPPVIVGNGQQPIGELIAAQSRRRLAATGGESHIPIDAETERTIRQVGYDMDSVLEAGTELQVRRTANLHTGGTIHDVTDIVHPVLVEAAVAAARAIDIPVTGIDLMVKAPTLPEYRFIEANERPGLANHEPQPTAERFIDLLFPLSIPAPVRQAASETPQTASEA
ncbi:N-acetylglutaminylglutamine synthetase [Stappia taiwanensis]|uniref:N-acetylglutaminylglutamine synthetase n=1 Tax=Stappia taiwanensis TaxID=992267 RepID=A0A838XYJ2_9HYPH|nr:N-acetylglutaminylglutamine synthetase [Stappia taiwanensis]MBA4613516.1 N-acetylglutaminylglutamine synthetase [Stappia taiwanensis]GGE96367.1 glutathione synthase [Stappia taiwanensis]